VLKNEVQKIYPNILSSNLQICLFEEVIAESRAQKVSHLPVEYIARFMLVQALIMLSKIGGRRVERANMHVKSRSEAKIKKEKVNIATLPDERLVTGQCQGLFQVPPAFIVVG
jgi:hypothetical protein